jgi:hypothetical protein
MAVVLIGKKIGLTDITVKVTVPENDTAILMYYLLSVSTVLSLETMEDNIARLTDYKNHQIITNDEKVKLLSLCKKFSPDKLEGKCFFHSDEIGGGLANRFFLLNSTEAAFVAAESVSIGAITVSVKTFMVYTMPWKIKCYTDPMYQAQRRENPAKRRENPAKRREIQANRRENQRAITSNNRVAIQTRTITPPVHCNTTRNNANWVYSSNSSSLDCCVIS